MNPTTCPHDANPEIRAVNGKNFPNNSSHFALLFSQMLKLARANELGLDNR